ncbi:MAG: IS4 family transposase [Pseudonocardia sp.]|nr:IS4 family transposase [Pseudonocardia sp.]
MGSWVDEETAACGLGDARLNRRLGMMLAALGERPGKSLPTAFQDWANTKAAYRFFSNGKVSEDKVLAGHFQASALRVQATEGPILVLQDTTEFSFKRAAPEKIGFTKTSTGRKEKDGRFRQHTICGLLMHASLAVTPEGLPLGLTAVKFWSRDRFKGTTALKRKINPTRVPIECKESVRWLDNLRRSTELIGAPERCVHIGDRESDIYELFCLARDLGTNFLVRSCVDRLAGSGGTTIAQVMKDVAPSGTHRVGFRDASGHEQEVHLAVKFATMLVRPPIGKQKRYEDQQLQIIHAEETDPPADRPPLIWKLITNLAVTTHEEAVHKLGWYARRWSIETFFKTLKTGCRIEEVRLTTADRLANCIALCCVVAWRIHWMTMLRRGDPDAAPRAVFTDAEIEFLDRSSADADPDVTRNLDFYMIRVARLGGYLARRHDVPPGATVMWRGLSRLADLAAGFTAGKESQTSCG